MKRVKNHPRSFATRATRENAKRLDQSTGIASCDRKRAYGTPRAWGVRVFEGAVSENPVFGR
jgi:hypothetical protein